METYVTKTQQTKATHSPEPGPADGRTGEPLLLRVEEFAQRCGIGRSLAYQMVWSGEIKHIRVGETGRGIRIPYAEATAWIERKLVEVA